MHFFNKKLLGIFKIKDLTRIFIDKFCNFINLLLSIVTANTWQGKFGVPSGIENSYYATDVSGNPLTIKNPNVVYVGNTIDDDKAKRIQKFAYRRFEKGLYVDRGNDDLKKSTKRKKK